MFLDHVGLSVADLDAQAAWYTKALGLRTSTPFEIEGLGLRGIFVTDGDTLVVELLQREGSRPGPQAADAPAAALTRGFGHICLRVPELDKAHKALLEAGAFERRKPQDSPEPGVRMSFVADPEGNLIELLDRSGPVGS